VIHAPWDPIIERLERLNRPIRLALVGCCKEKAPLMVGTEEQEQPARDLYRSPLFRKALQHAEATSDLTIILSAFYEAIHPDTTVTSYERTLKDYGGKSDVAAWAWRAFLKTGDYLPTGKPVIVTPYCGRDYSDPVLAHAPQWHVVEPLAGRGIGDRLSWFKSRSARRELVRHQHLAV